jgi:ketosteroid isomerase-like protein
MYKALVRALVRRNIAHLNQGDPEPLLRLASPDIELVFPGDNSWAAMHRPVQKGRSAHVTHRGIEECRAFARRFVDEHIQFAIEDVVVNGPPWRTRVAVRAHDYAEGPDGDRYNNRAVAWIELRWGRIVRWEDYEDTERVAGWDRAGRASLVG